MNKDGTGAGKEEHIHEPMQPIECDILYINAEMDQYIADNPTASIKRFYEQKEIELTNRIVDMIHKETVIDIGLHIKKTL